MCVPSAIPRKSRWNAIRVSSADAPVSAKVAGGLIVAVAADGMVQDLAGRLHRSFYNLRNLPFHSAGLDFFLGYTAGLARVRLYYGTGAILQLTRAARSHQNIPVIAVKPLNQFHRSLRDGRQTGKIERCQNRLNLMEH